MPEIRITSEVHESGEPNGSRPTGPDDDSSFPPNEDFSPSSGPDFRVILDAPKFETLIKRKQTPRSKEYQTRVASALKVPTLAAIQSSNLPDAAALLAYGPGAAIALGDLADTNERARATIDFLTSPNSPVLATVVTLLPLVSQLLRNHELKLKTIPESLTGAGRKARAERKSMRKAQRAAEPPRFTIRALGREIPVRFRVRLPRLGKMFSGVVRAQSADPDALTIQVFTDPNVIRELAKFGIQIRTTDAQG